MSRLRLDSVRILDRGPWDLEIDAGECVALSGPSGSGKTLLLRAIADLDRHGGRVFLDGIECNTVPAPAWRRRVGYLPAESAWWADRVGAHFLHIHAETLARLGFGAEVLDWVVDRLSTGERQRLALARLLANRPEALLLDEPTANLDPEAAGRVEDLVASYRQENAAAVLWVGHNREQGRRMASRHHRIDGARLLEEGDE